MQLNENITIQKGDCCELIKKLPDYIQHYTDNSQRSMVPMIRRGKCLTPALL